LKKHNCFQKLHQARSQEGVERQLSHSQIFRNLNFLRQNCTLFSYPVFKKDQYHFLYRNCQPV